MEINQDQPQENLAVIEAKINPYEQASMLKITDEEQKKLLAPIDKNMVEIKPDGMIYLPQVFTRQLLNNVFGIGQWALIRKDVRVDQANSVVFYQGILMIRGCYVSEGVGEGKYVESNKNMTWATSVESAKSDCLVRCCKDLSIASEMWQPQFTRSWQKEFAVEVWCKMQDGKSKKQWRRKNAPKFWNEQGQTEQVAPEAQEESTQSTSTPTTQQSKEKPWLNKMEPGGKEFTKEYANTSEKLRSGAITMATVEGVYKLSKEMKAHLLTLIPQK